MSRRALKRVVGFVCLTGALSAFGCGFDGDLFPQNEQVKNGSGGATLDLDPPLGGEGGEGPTDSVGGSTVGSGGSGGGGGLEPLGQPLRVVGRQYSFCAEHESGVACWGRNDSGQLGTGSGAVQSTPARLNVDVSLSQLSMGDVHACGRDTLGQLYCWGGNDVGQLGRAPDDGSLTPERAELDLVEAVAAGFQHTCAIARGGKLYCFGQNGEGQLGLGTGAEPAPVAVPTLVLPDATWTELGAGDGHTCGVQDDGSLWCWGRNAQSQLGLGASASGQVREPTRVGTSNEWVSVEASLRSTCARRATGALYCFGENDQGQLGLTNATSASSPQAVTGGLLFDQYEVGVFHTCGLTFEGKLYCWGRRLEGQLQAISIEPARAPIELGAELAPFLSVAVSRFSTCALRSADRRIYCTGRNSDGEVGVGSQMPAEVEEFLQVANP